MPKYDRMAEYRKKMPKGPPWTGTENADWAAKGRLAQKRLNKRRDQAIKRTEMRRRGQRSR